MTWFFADQYCFHRGFSLVQLTDPLVIEWVKQNVSGFYRLGGKRNEPNGSFYWTKTGEKVKNNNIAWPNYTRIRTDGIYCISSDGNTRKDLPCGQKLAWLCQGSESDYYSALRLKVVPHGRSHFSVGEKVKVTCSSRAHGDPTKLEILAGDHKHYFVDGNKIVELNKEKLQIYHILIKGPKYRYIGQRCFADYAISLWFNANINLNNTKLRCCSRKETCVEKNLLVYRTPITPVVTLDSDPYKRFLYIGDEIHYFCIARLALTTAMTVVINQIDRVWAMSYTMNGTRKEIGELWQKEDVKEISTVVGRSVWWGGNHINFTLIFKARAYHEGHSISCYSKDVFEKVLHLSNDTTDYLRDRRVLGITTGPRAPVFKMKLPHHDNEDRYLLYGCDTVKASCVAQTGRGGHLRFVVILPSRNHSWSSKYPEMNDLPEWVHIRNHEVGKGHIERLDISLEVWKETIDAQFECVSEEGRQSLRKSIAPHFIYKIGSLPPVLISFASPRDKSVNIGDGQNNILDVDLHCTGYVGWGDTQTWEVLDYEGNEFHWFISTRNKVRGYKGLPFWLKLDLIYESFDMCGQVMSTRVSAVLQPDVQGITFTCYSLDIWRNYTSAYTVHQLSKSYSVLKGGKRYSHGIPQLPLFWIFFALGILSVAWIVVATTYFRTYHSSNVTYFSEQSNHVYYLEDSSDISHFSEQSDLELDVAGENSGPETERTQTSRPSFGLALGILQNLPFFNDPSEDPNPHLDKSMLTKLSDDLGFRIRALSLDQENPIVKPGQDQEKPSKKSSQDQETRFKKGSKDQEKQTKKSSQDQDTNFKKSSQDQEKPSKKPLQDQYVRYKKLAQDQSTGTETSLQDQAMTAKTIVPEKDTRTMIPANSAKGTSPDTAQDKKSTPKKSVTFQVAPKSILKNPTKPQDTRFF